MMYTLYNGVCASERQLQLAVIPAARITAPIAWPALIRAVVGSIGPKISGPILEDKSVSSPSLSRHCI
jgi:hypothetical protein